MNNPRGETILGQLKQITGNAASLTAADHPTFQALMEVDQSMGAALVVVRQRRIEQQLGSGATNLITLEHLTEAGHDALAAHDNNPTMGRIATRIEAVRSFEFRGNRFSEQWTQLGIEFDQDGSLHFVPDGRVPFDNAMEADTREAWEQWGCRIALRPYRAGRAFCYAADA